MIVVHVEIWPYGDPEGSYEIGQIVAWNEGGNAALSSYSGSVIQAGSASLGVKSWEQEFRVEGHDGTDGPWRLIASILSAIDLQVQP